MLYDQAHRRVIRTESLSAGVDSRVEQVAGDFVCQGLVLTDADTHSVAPATCPRSALKDDHLAVYFIPEDVRNQVRDLEHAIAASKRRAASELDRASRPQKVRVRSNNLISVDGHWYS